MSTATTKKEKSMLLDIGSIGFSGMYAFQEARIGAENRLRNLIFRKVTGLDLRETQKKKDKASKALVKQFKNSDIEDHLSELIEEGKISPKERDFINRLHEIGRKAEEQEEEYEKFLAKVVKKEPLWTNFLQYVRGIGTRMAAALMYYFRYCEKAKHVSSMWAYAGLTPTSKHKKGEDSNFNTRLRMFLLGRLFPCFLKSGNKRYRAIYDAEKERQIHRLETDHKHAPNSTGHAHARARRYAVKEFLKDYFDWCCWYTGREHQDPWVVAEGGHSVDVTKNSIFDYLREKGCERRDFPEVP